MALPLFHFVPLVPSLGLLESIKDEIIIAYDIIIAYAPLTNNLEEGFSCLLLGFLVVYYLTK